MTEFRVADIIPFDVVEKVVTKVKCNLCLNTKTPAEGIIDTGAGHAICFECVTKCTALIKAHDGKQNV